MMTNFHLNTTVIAIFPNVCLWRRSLCSDLVLTLKNRIEPPSYARTAYVVAIWPSFLFDSFVKIWETCEIFLGKWFTAPPGKKFPYAYGLNWGQDRVFFIQENVTFIQLSIYQSHNQFLPAVNKMMKTKSLYILLPVSKFCVNLQYKKTCETLTEI